MNKVARSRSCGIAITLKERGCLRMDYFERIAGEWYERAPSSPIG
jgi:hypothetical protein